MKTFLAFLKKENMELKRTGRLLILLIVFILFGIMNPAIAKITPWMMETLADSLKESGLAVTEVVIDAMTSWTQFYKNIPMALIIFVLMCGSSFTYEYQKGTLITVLTKGLSRWKVAAAKSTVLILLWTICYWLCFFITYGYNAYFWDNSIALNLFFSAVCYWLFGIWVIALIILFSSISNGSTSVFLGTGACILAAYIIGLLPKVNNFTPIKLTDSMSLLKGLTVPGDYMPAAVASLVTIVICISSAILAFNKMVL